MQPVEHNQKSRNSSDTAVITVFGASGDLARKKIYPALFGLYKLSLLPSNLKIIGYARSVLSKIEFSDRIRSCLKKQQSNKNDPNDSLLEEQLKNDFLAMCDYIHGGYDDQNAFKLLKDLIGPCSINVCYLALPPSMFLVVSHAISSVLLSDEIDTRIIVEKPFGHDSCSSAELSLGLSKMFKESQEMVKNLLILRFANIFFESVWNNENISNVQITFKEPFGVEGRAGYFDEYGIIRDVMQNHLLQIMSLIAMEKPKSLNSEDIRDEKVRVLRKTLPLSVQNTVIGQYSKSRDGLKKGYLDDKEVPDGSKTATFAACVLYVNDVRWRDVPFILKCGKALNEQKAEIRIQFKDPPNPIFPEKDVARNELVIRLQPNEAIYMKIVSKQPGLIAETVISELDLTYKMRYSDIRIPDAYESLLLDVFNGDHSNFVRDDELEAAWAVFTPALRELDLKSPIEYEYGSRGPPEADALIESVGFIRAQKEYIWKDNKL